MRLNSLKAELKKWAQSQIPKEKPEPEEPPPPKPEPIPKYPVAKPKEPVVGGDIKWKPVDRTAALVVSKTPWWAQPLPPNTPEPSPPEKPQPRKPRMPSDISKMIDISKVTLNTAQQTPSGSYLIGGVEHFNVVDLVPKIIAELNRTPHELTPLARALVDAREVIHENTNGIGLIMDESHERISKGLTDIRESRHAILRECAMIAAAMKEIRQFFLGDNYEKEIERLRVFVDLCERLLVLKEKGFLDKVADTMLNLAITKDETEK